MFSHSFFPLGVGTNRLSIAGPKDFKGLESAAGMIAAALEAGASYVDVAQTYSKGMAEAACKLAFAQTAAKKDVTVKASFLLDQTEDDALRRTEVAFDHMGIDHAFCFVIWNISSYEQFREIMKSGSLYDGALKAKERGLVKHVCFSTHAPPQDIIKILDTKAFEGVTISLSALNGQIMKPVLDCAEKNGVDVVVMNPLGGGFIPQQADFFSFLRSNGETTAQAALRYAYAHPAVKIVLSGMASMVELQENLTAFRENAPEKPDVRLERVRREFQYMEGVCTGCRYCDGCPQNINIFELMQAYNTTLFPQPPAQYGRTEPQLLKTMGICSRLKNTFGFLPPDSVNPCMRCGQCESKCTAHLPIMERIQEMYQQFSDSGFSWRAMLERLQGIIGSHRRVAFYPGGGYTAAVLAMLPEAFPQEVFELSVFDSNPTIWGSVVGGNPVRAPEEIVLCQPDLVIVSNYIYADAIEQDLKKQLHGTIPVVKLHNDQDVPWVF